MDLFSAVPLFPWLVSGPPVFGIRMQPSRTPYVYFSITIYDPATLYGFISIIVAEMAIESAVKAA